jgi:hypothetical protein
MPVDHDMASLVGVTTCWQETEDRALVNGTKLEEQLVDKTRYEGQAVARAEGGRKKRGDDEGSKEYK